MKSLLFVVTAMILIGTSAEETDVDPSSSFAQHWSSPSTATQMPSTSASAMTALSSRNAKISARQLGVRSQMQRFKARREKAEKHFEAEAQRVRLPIDHVWESVRSAAATEDIGTRRYMEDDYIMLDQFMGVEGHSFFAVYDGHGGREAVDFVVRALHLNFRHYLKNDPTESPSNVFEKTYLLTDSQIRTKGILQAGTTACTVFIRKESGQRILHAANAGDSRVVLGRKDGSLSRLSLDHKPSLESEKERIEAAGGFVGRKNRVNGGFVGWKNRVNGGFVRRKNRVNGILAMSRALGDHMMKPAVSAVPYTVSVILQDEDFLILASDGIWDVISDEDAVKFVRERLYGDDGTMKLDRTGDIAKALCKAAQDKRSRDNITVVIVVP